jgi:hypothetical protein
MENYFFIILNIKLCGEENLVGVGEGPFHKVELREEPPYHVVTEDYLLLQGPDVCLVLMVAVAGN